MKATGLLKSNSEPSSKEIIDAMAGGWIANPNVFIQLPGRELGFGDLAEAARELEVTGRNRYCALCNAIYAATGKRIRHLPVGE